MNGTTTRKFSRREFAALFLGAALTGRAQHASAAENPAERYVGRIADEVMSLANSGAKGTALRGRFVSVLNRYVNLRSIANFALGPYQKQLPPGDKNKFYALFGSYAAASLSYVVLFSSTRGAGALQNNYKTWTIPTPGPRPPAMTCRRSC
jgi:ABC-type transporter MlaC component